jgi:hypothetical protein
VTDANEGIFAGSIRLWVDPVCPFSWNTARWLRNAATDVGFDIDWHLMNLAVLNEGRELPPPQRTRMEDSRQVGRLMAALRDELGAAGVAQAYFAFGEEYFDRQIAVGESLAKTVLAAVGARATTPGSLSDASLDEAVRQSHQASQQALGAPGGSPMVTIGGHTFFGPVLTAVPARDEGKDLLRAVVTLSATSQFSQLERPRVHG